MTSFGQTTVNYRKVRGSFRFLLSNLVDFDFRTQLVPFEELSLLDRCILASLNDVCQDVHRQLTQFSVHNVLFFSSFSNLLGN